MPSIARKRKPHVSCRFSKFLDQDRVRNSKDRGLSGPSRLAEMKRYTDIRWIKGTEIGVVEARVIKILCERATGKNERGETKYRIGLDLQEGEFVDLAGNGGGSFSWRAKAEVGVDAFLPR